MEIRESNLKHDISRVKMEETEDRVHLDTLEKKVGITEDDEELADMNIDVIKEDQEEIANKKKYGKDWKKPDSKKESASDRFLDRLMGFGEFAKPEPVTKVKIEHEDGTHSHKYFNKQEHEQYLKDREELLVKAELEKQKNNNKMKK